MSSVKQLFLIVIVTVLLVASGVISAVLSIGALSASILGQQASAVTCAPIAQSFDNNSYIIKPSAALRFKGEQLVNAGKIYTWGRKLGFKQWEITGMIQTAIQESDLKNLPYGEGTSVGLWQHIEEYYGDKPRMDVDWSTKNRYQKLAENKDRENMEPFEVFLQMQGASRSAYLNPRHNWHMWKAEAEALYAAAQANAGAQIQVAGNALVLPDQDYQVAFDSTGGQACTTGVDAIYIAMVAAQGQVGQKLKIEDDRDGSGLVKWAYEQAGVAVKDTPKEQFEDGVSVDNRNDLTKGDVLYFGTGSDAINKVALYAGNNRILWIGSNGKVVETELSFDNYVGASRPVPMPLKAFPTTQVNGNPIVGGWTKPVTGKYNVGSRFGEPRSRPPYYHDGLDLNGMPKGHPVLAVASGTVLDMQRLDYSYGWHIKLEHGNGSIVTIYAHMSAFANGLQVGQVVNAGEVIGYIGSTGNSTGNHLHFVVKVGGKPIDPIVFMRNHGVPLE